MTSSQTLSFEVIDLPVVEASGVAIRPGDDHNQVLVVGDRHPDVAVGTYGPGEDIAGWRTIDLSSFAGWPVPAGDSEFEAIAVDGGSLVAVLREGPSDVLVLDVDRRSLTSRIRLVVPRGSGLAKKWRRHANSRGEGLVLLRDGRLLVAKEKRPRCLIVFAPVGTDPAPLSGADLLEPGESWPAPSAAEAEFRPVGIWKLKGDAKDAFEDISALAAGPVDDLWLLSDQSEVIGRLPLDPPLDPAVPEIHDIPDVWALPEVDGKPEGLATLDDERIIVALDTPSPVDNGLVLTRTPG